MQLIMAILNTCLVCYQVIVWVVGYTHLIESELWLFLEIRVPSRDSRKESFRWVGVTDQRSSNYV